MIQILVPNFTVTVPGFDLNQNYNIDFYADHNGNETYDAPPVDHAWRLTFNSSTGDHVSDFIHNTSFTDIQWPGATAVEDEAIAVDGYSLEQNYPNPFNPSTTISFSIPENQFVSLKLYNLIGQEIKTLINGNLEKGNHTVQLNAEGLSSGIYLYKLESNNNSLVRKMTLLK